MSNLKKIVRLAWKNPRLAINKARTTLRTEIIAKRDYHFKNGTARPPNAVCIKLTNACNLRCQMCGQQREGHKPGDPKYAPKSFFQQKTTLETFRRVIDELAGVRPNLYLWGGEPFMYPQLFELISYAKSRRFTVQINTNGLFLQKYARETVESGLDDLIVSIDGPEAVHDAVRGRVGTFAKVREGIEAINRLKQETGKGPVVRVRGTISPYNFEHIYSLTDIARDLGADSLNFNWTWFTTRESGKAYQKLMKEVFDTDAFSWIPFESDVIFDPERRNKYDGIRRELRKFAQNRFDLPVSMSPHIRPEQVETYYENIRETFGHRTCYSVYVKSYILPNGDVTPCPDFPDYICGNINEQPFLDIWNGERYRKWRLELKKRGLLPACNRCCDLFLSDVKFF